MKDCLNDGLTMESHVVFTNLGRGVKSVHLLLGILSYMDQLVLGVSHRLLLLMVSLQLNRSLC